MFKNIKMWLLLRRLNLKPSQILDDRKKSIDTISNFLYVEHDRVGSVEKAAASTLMEFGDDYAFSQLLEHIAYKDRSRRAHSLVPRILKFFVNIKYRNAITALILLPTEPTEYLLISYSQALEMLQKIDPEWQNAKEAHRAISILVERAVMTKNRTACENANMILSEMGTAWINSFRQSYYYERAQYALVKTLFERFNFVRIIDHRRAVQLLEMLNPSWPSLEFVKKEANEYFPTRLKDNDFPPEEIGFILNCVKSSLDEKNLEGIMHYQGSETVHNMGGTGRVTFEEAGYSSVRWIAIQELERRKEARSS